MLAESGSDQRARIRALPKGACARHVTTCIHNNQYNTQAKAMTYAINK